MKKISTYIFACILLLTGFALTSCEKTEFLKSEKGVMSELNGTWSMIQIPSTLPAESWTIDNGVLIRKGANSEGTSLREISRGTISVHTTLTKVEVTIEGMPSYNGTWQVIKLNKSVMVINTDFDGNSGIMEKTFQKQ